MANLMVDQITGIINFCWVCDLFIFHLNGFSLQPIINILLFTMQYIDLSLLHSLPVFRVFAFICETASTECKSDCKAGKKIKCL